MFQKKALKEKQAGKFRIMLRSMLDRSRGARIQKTRVVEREKTKHTDK
jgi:hypothetical protein